MTAPAPATTIDTRATRGAAAAMLGLGVAWRRLPVHPPFACPFRSITGYPCPLCGMTRSVVAAVHGQLYQSLRFNPGGILAVVLAVALIAGFRLDRIRRAPWIFVVVLSVMWVWNLGFNPTFR